MHIEIDQSGKIEQTSLDTALAFTDTEIWSILIPAGVKRAAQRELRARGVKSGTIVLRMFAAGLFLLLREHLDVVTSITIDAEYWGQEGEIKGLLLHHIWSERPYFPKDAISFRSTKGSPAHSPAWRTRRGEREPDKRVELEELLRFC